MLVKPKLNEGKHLHKTELFLRFKCHLKLNVFKTTKQ